MKYCKDVHRNATIVVISYTRGNWLFVVLRNGFRVGNPWENHQNATILVHTRVYRANNVACALRARWRGFEWYRLLGFRLAHHVTRRFCCVAEWLSRRKSVRTYIKMRRLERIVGAELQRNFTRQKENPSVCITLLLIPKVAKAKV